MCGIAALVEPGRTFDDHLLDAVDRDLLHRGPDAGGRLSEPGVALVHRRLSILDPTAAADQPMTDPSGTATLVFNGEIYNYRALRADLVAAGHRLRTDGDSEALLLGYLEWGDEVFSRAEGMFAAVLLDRRHNCLVAARDPLGIKPLYLWQARGRAMLASEVRPMRHMTALVPDEQALSELIHFRWAAGRLSNYRDIERVPGGTVLRIGLADAGVVERRFADPLDTLRPDRTIGRDRALELAREEVTSSVRAHLASDVGYTVQLSGGVDSSLVAAIAGAHTDRPLRTFALHLPGYEHDERKWRDMLLARYAFDHHEIEVSGRDFADALPRAVAHMEGPSPHLGCVLLMRLCDRIARDAKVVLTGEGADEFFGGYFRYGEWRKTALQAWLAKVLPTRLLPNRWPFAGVRRLAGFDPAALGGVYHAVDSMMALFPGLSPVAGAREAASARFDRFIERLFAVDQSAYLDSLLLRQDKMAMAASVEARVPFVHMPLARVMNRIPREIVAPGRGRTKPLLKKIAEPHVPREVLYRRKVGLRLPVADWLRDDAGLGRYIDDVTAPSSRLAGYCDRARLSALADDTRRGDPQAAALMVQMVNVECWLRSIPARTVGPTVDHAAGPTHAAPRRCTA